MKLLIIFKWISVMFINLLGFITAPIIYPLAYLVRNNILRKVFWFYYDDEDGHYGTEWWRESKELEEGKFKTAYLWSAIRNPAWNLQASLKPKKGDVEIVDIKILTLTRNGVLLGNAMEFAVLKYVNDKGEYKDNKGDYLSLRHSILGSVYTWYKIDGTLYFRRSFAKKFGKFWIELHLGVTDKRYTFRFKVKRKLKIYEEL